MQLRQKIAFIVIIAFSVVTIGGIYWGILPDTLEDYRKQTTEIQRLTVSEFLDSLNELGDAGVELTGTAMLGEPVVKADGARVRFEYVYLQSEVPETQNCLLTARRQTSHKSLGEKLASGQLKGRIQSGNFADINEETQAYLREAFPDVDFEKTALVRHRDFQPVWFSWCLYLAIVWQLASAAYITYLLFKKRKKQPWQDKIQDDRTEIYRQHQHAMRLIGNDSYADGSLRQRAVDSEFDVAAVKQVKHRKPKRVVYYVLAAAAYLVVSMWTKAQIRESELLANVDSLWLELATALPLLFGYMFLANLSKSAATGRGEEPIAVEKAGYRLNEFHKYHAKVLNELGFIEVGDFEQIGAAAALTRTIYLNPTGNLLVEVGTESGIAFFTLETLTNTGKFLETHSMATQAHETRDESKIHQRRSADHQDIVKALETHDELVSKYTFTGSAHEAKFTVENFARFLAYPSVKKLA